MDFILTKFELAANFVEPYLIWGKFASALLSALFLWGIVYSVRKSRLFTQQTDQLLDAFNVKTLPKRRALLAWKQVVRRMHAGGINNWKLAIIEADRIFDEILKLSGFSGETMDDRLKQAEGGQIANLEKLIQSHRIAKRITQDPEFAVDEGLARETLKNYELLFREFGLVD